MTRNLLAPIAACAFLAFVLVPSPAPAGPEKVSPRLQAHIHPDAGYFNYAKALGETEGILGAASPERGVRVLIHADVDRETLEGMGVTVTGQAGNVFSAWIPPDRILPVADLPGTRRIEAARRFETTLDQATAYSNIRTELWGSSVPPYPGDAGAGVVIGDVDTGFDYNHEDFRTAGGNSRFHAIWDQTQSGGPSPPGFGYGRLWDQTSLDNETATTVDLDGHGTHVIGIGGGSGRGTDGDEPQYKYAGGAPEATLVGVKTRFFDVEILDGVNFIFQQGTALGLPAVANLSLGGHFGPHDGTDPFEVGLDNLAGPGKVVVVSAGNEGDQPIHAQGTIAASGPPVSSILEFEYTVGAYAPNPTSSNDFIWFLGYYAGTDEYDVTVTSPTGISHGVSQGDPTLTEPTPDGYFEIHHNTTTSGGDREVEIIIWDFAANRPPADGIWTFRFDRVTSTEANIDMWNAVNSSNIPGGFTSGQTFAGTVASPGTAIDVITVGAYTTKWNWQSTNGGSYQWAGCPCTNGEIADFSARGPTRDGRIKPTVSAPGFGVGSTLSMDFTFPGSLIPLKLPDDHHWMLTGTSMASPMAASVAGMILAQNPTFTPDQVAQRITDFAVADGFTGAVPNNTWGHGKLDGQAADSTPPGVTVVSPNGGEAVSAGSTEDIQWTASDNFGGSFGIDSVDLEYSTDGGTTWMSIATGEANDGTYPWSVPETSADSAMVRVLAYDALGNQGSDVSDDVFAITSVIGVEDGPVTPVFMLGPSRPNPLIGARRAEIRFGLSEDGPARLSVFDAAGRLVVVLADRTFPAGFHTVSWDASDRGGSRVASGQYFYRLETGEGTVSRKLLVL